MSQKINKLIKVKKNFTIFRKYLYLFGI
jgi:hypothetical protein